MKIEESIIKEKINTEEDSVVNNVNNIKLNDIEKIVYEKILRDVKKIEENVIKKIVSENYSLLLGEEDVIEGFSNYLDSNGIDIGKDISYIVTGTNEKDLHPVTLTKVNRITGQMQIIQLCMIKKSDILINLIGKEIRKERYDDEEEGYKFDVKKLITITVEDVENGKSVYSRFLEKDKELSEKNVMEITRTFFDPERTFMEAVKDIRKEEENEQIMYG